jgi:hypothetical protein
LIVGIRAEENAVVESEGFLPTRPQQPGLVQLWRVAFDDSKDPYPGQLMEKDQFVKRENLFASLVVGAALCAALVAPVSAAPLTIDFEDVAAPGASSFLAPGYKGFTWSGGYGGSSWVITDSTDPFYWGFVGVPVHSGKNYAWSNGGTNLSLAGGTFDFNGFWARAGGGAFTAIAHGFVGSTETFTQSFTVSDVYQQFTFNFLGIDTLTITDQATNLLVDDILVNAVGPVPEPETYAMMLAGLGLLGVVARRRKRQSVA